MEIPNAFIGKSSQPTPHEIAEALGPSASLWDELIDWLAGQNLTEQDWKPVYPNKYGWSARIKLGKRTILYLGPCSGCFRVAFVLGDKAVAAARKSTLDKRVINEIEGAKRYAEGTGVRIVVRKASDLRPIKTLVQIKLEN